MENFLIIFNQVLDFISSNPVYVYGILLVAVIFTVVTKGVQLRYFMEGWRLLFKKNDDKEGASSFKAAMLSIGGRVGTGNVAGVAVAIIMGGAGAIFWMWVVALLGMASAFMESTLGQYHKEKNEDHIYVGGPSYYIEKESRGKLKWLAIVYSIVMIIAKGLFVLSIQASTILNSTYTAFHIEKTSFIGIAVVVVILLLIIYAILGGMDKLMNVLSVIVPIMTVGYIILVLIIIVGNLNFVPIYFKLVFTQAFKPLAILGGGIGVAISNGVKRGIFSNEAGQGTGAIAGASGGVNHPVEQGLVQMNTVFIDTIVICTLSSFVIILAFYNNGVDFLTNYQIQHGYSSIQTALHAAQSDIAGGTLAAIGFENSIKYGGKIVAVFLFFFAFSSMLALMAYGMQSVKYLFKKKSKKVNHIALRVYGLAVILMIVFTPFLDDLASKNQNFNFFVMGDNLVSILFYINIITMVVLLPKLIRLVKDYDKKKKAGGKMAFNSKEFDPTMETESWN